MLREGAVQISLDLLRGEIVLPHGLLHEVFVVPRVRGLLIDGTWEIPTVTTSGSGSPVLGLQPQLTH